MSTAAKVAERWYCLIHPTPGCMGEASIWPLAIEIWEYNVSLADVRAFLWPEWVVVAAFPTREQAWLDLGVRIGN